MFEIFRVGFKRDVTLCHARFKLVSLKGMLMGDVVWMGVESVFSDYGVLVFSVSS